MADLETFFQPVYQLIVWPHRLGVGVPYSICRECVEAVEWCERAVVLEGELARVLRQLIQA